MMQTPIVSEIEASGISEVTRILSDNQLPIEDLSEKIDFYSFKAGENLIGIGGLEQYDSVGLLRSVAIVDGYKGQGLGTQWTKQLLDIAAHKNIKELFLLTTTAEKFFQTLGFKTIDRSVVPEAIQNTSEFASVCPSSAAVMAINLSIWSEDESDIFIEYGDFFVPERETQHQIFASWLSSVSPLEKAAELCSGEGKLSGHLLREFPNLQITGLDGSTNMLQTSEKNLQEFGERFKGQAFRLEEKVWRGSFSGLNAVVSSLAIHHLDGAEKKELFSDVYQMLKPGGVFVIADIISPAHEFGYEVAAKAWDDYVKHKAIKAGKPEIFDLFTNDGWNYFRNPDDDPIDKPSPLTDQLIWLQEAGFEAVDVSWVFAGHAIFGGRKKI